jgi:drug/metabolite transporter (DMT)-like permease
MPENRKQVLITYIKLFAAIAIWGGSFIATKIAVREVSPVTVVWLRFLIGIVILGVIARARDELAIPTKKDGLDLVMLGFLGITLHQWLQSTGLVTSEASTTAWLVSTTPIFMALLGWLFFKEKITLLIASGILLASIGVLFVITKGNFLSIFGGNFGAPGDILIILSAPNWALFSVLSKPLLHRLSPLKVTFYTLFFGWLLTSVQFLAVRGWSEFSQLSWSGWASIGFLGVFCSALAYIFYNEGVKHFSSSQVGVFLYLEPVVATLVAVFVLSERFTWASLAGAGFIVLGVWVVNRQKNPEDDLA